MSCSQSLASNNGRKPQGMSGRGPLLTCQRKVVMSHLGYMGHDCWLLLQTNSRSYHHRTVYVTQNQTLDLSNKNQSPLCEWRRQAGRPTQELPPSAQKHEMKVLALFTFKSRVVLEKCTLLKCPVSELY